MLHYRHPQPDGQVSFEDQVFDIVPVKSKVKNRHGDEVDGVVGIVECPARIGDGADWPRASADEIEAHRKASGGRSKSPSPTREDAALETLDGTVSDVETFLETVTTASVLEALEAAETAGKNRKGVLDALEARLEQLSKPPAV